MSKNKSKSASKFGSPAQGDDSDRRIIEWKIPLAAVNAASSREKKHPRRHL